MDKKENIKILEILMDLIIKKKIIILGKTQLN